MSIDFIKVKRDLVKWAKTYSGITAEGRHIWAFQNAPRPQAPYVLLNITGPTKIGNTDSLLYNKENLSYDVTGVRIFNLEVNVYGSNALNIATKLSLSIERPDVQQYFRGVNLTPYGSSPSVSHVPSKLDTIYEERAMFELRFMGSYIIETGETFIEQVKTQGINEMQKGEDNKITIGG